MANQSSLLSGFEASETLPQKKGIWVDNVFEECPVTFLGPPFMNTHRKRNTVAGRVRGSAWPAESMSRGMVGPQDYCVPLTVFSTPEGHSILHCVNSLTLIHLPLKVGHVLAEQSSDYTS